MSTPSPEPAAAPAEAAAAAAAGSDAVAAAAGAPPAAASPPRPPLLAVGLAVLALALAVALWIRLSGLQEQLGRQGADTAATAAEARTLVRHAQEQERELAARVAVLEARLAELAVLEARLAELAVQRAQLDELMQSLSRSRDENLVVDIESAIALAQQQAQLTGSIEPLLMALRTAEARLQRTPQARLAPVQRALARDLARIKSTPVPDLPTLLARMDELIRLVDELPLANTVTPAARTAATAAPDAAAQAPQAPLWQRLLQEVAAELRQLVRVSRIDQPEAVLLSPEQSFFLRENLKLLLLNARLGLLARQHEAARADLRKAEQALRKYFDPAAARHRSALQLLQQSLEQSRTLELPRAEETLAALASAAAAR
ncbi:MAG: uroporphyrinogen-III C-methyltransferase [Hylemonella sp.]